MCAGSWRLCRSILPRNCCIRKVLPVLLHPEVLPVLPSQVLPLPLLGSEFLASSQSGYLLLGSEFSSFSAERLPAELVKLVTSTSTHIELVISTSTQGVLWLACITRVLLPSQEDIAGSWWSCRSILPRKCCLRKVLPVLPSQALSLPSLGSEMSSSCTWLVSSCCRYRYWAVRCRP